MDPRLFTGITQVGVVTADIERAMRTWFDKYGVGPWRVYEWAEHDACEMERRERPERYAMRTALSELGAIGVELLQPLDDCSIYAESLQRHGGRDHLHHLLLDTDDHADAKRRLRQRGIISDQSGVIAGIRFDYLDTVPDLGFWIEIVDFSHVSQLPPPTATYPMIDSGRPTSRSQNRTSTSSPPLSQPIGGPMPDHVYKSIEVTGSSQADISDAVRKAVAKASETVRNIEWVEVISVRAHVEDGDVAHFQVTTKIGFRLE